MTASGTCGDNLTWTLDDDGVLTISGTGDMDSNSRFSTAPWYSYRSSIKSVVIKNGVTSIGDFAFYSCCNLESVTIPDSVTSIGKSAFYYCIGLESVTIPDSVTDIRNSAFSYCTGLPSVSIPNISIGRSVFDGCTSLTDLTITGTGKIKYGDGTENSSPWYGTSIQFVVIGDGITSIDNYMFYDCSSLESVTIPDSVESIGSYAFYNCYNLASVTIPDSVTEINDYAFAYCLRLTEITFEGDSPIPGVGVFLGVVATAYYPEDNDTWTQGIMNAYSYDDAYSYNDTAVISWVAYTKPEDPPDSAETEDSATDGVTPNGVDGTTPDGTAVNTGTGGSSGSGSGTSEKYTPGDINGDDNVNISDVQTLLKHVNGQNVAIF